MFRSIIFSCISCTKRKKWLPQLLQTVVLPACIRLGHKSGKLKLAFRVQRPLVETFIAGYGDPGRHLTSSWMRTPTLEYTELHCQLMSDPRGGTPYQRVRYMVCI